jgi:tRNA(adenine34) deaminase
LLLEDRMASHHCSGANAASSAVSRRGIVTALGSAALLSATRLPCGARAAAAGSADDEGYMRMALREASRGDFPFGAVIVRDGRVIARGRNLGRTNGDPTAHGEMVAIRRCLADHGAAALQGSTLYTSGEPCVMCMGAILSGAGSVGWSLPRRSRRSPPTDDIMITSAEVAAKAPFLPIAITGGVLADEAQRLLAR